MSLAEKMKLQDLKAKVEALNVPRRELLNKQINDAAVSIQNEVLEFFKSKGFSITGQIPKLKATYNGGLETTIDLSNLKGNFWGCDGCIDFKYENKPFVINYSVVRGKAPERGSWSGSQEKLNQMEMDYYEGVLLPYLQSVGVSDLSGEVILFTFVKNATGNMRSNANTKKYQSIEHALNDFMN